MKRFTLSLSVLALILAAAVQVGLAQPGNAGPAPQAISKTQILISINRAELTAEQLQSLQGIVTQTIAAQDAVVAAQAELETFLVNWTGTAEEFDAAFQAAQEPVMAAVDALHALKVANTETIKDSLSANQFQEMARVLVGVMGVARDDAPGAPQDAPAGPQGNDRGNDRGPNNDNQRRDGGQGPGGIARAPLAGHLDILLEVLNEKIAAIGA